MSEPYENLVETTKVFLRRRDGLFYGVNGIWTESADVACTFENASKALMVGRSFALPGMEIVIRASDGLKFIPITT